MINHARTLLLNVSGRTSQRDAPGEEYIPPTYSPLVLPSYLETPHKILFGTAPDRYFLNFRARELMAYLHSTELAEYVYALDPRVTYWPERGQRFYDVEKQLRAEQIVGLPAPALTFRGDLFADNTRGRAVREFTFRVTAESGTWQALVASADKPTVVQTTAVTFTGGLSQAIPLADTGISVQTHQPPSATTWNIYTRVKPAPALTTLLPTLEILGEPLFLELLGVGEYEQPYSTFKQLWFDHPNPVYRLGGLALGVIYRTQAILEFGGYRAA